MCDKNDDDGYDTTEGGSVYIEKSMSKSNSKRKKRLLGELNKEKH